MRIVHQQLIMYKFYLEWLEDVRPEMPPKTLEALLANLEQIFLLNPLD